MEEENKQWWKNPYLIIIAFILLVNLVAIAAGFLKTNY
jgi:uncharacterized protein YpmS